MVLREYLYIDEDFVNNAFTSINGYNYDRKNIQYEDTEELKEEVEADGQRGRSEKTTTAVNANITLISKLQVVMDFLMQDLGGEIPFFDCIKKEDISYIKRESFFEGLFKLSFTKIETYSKLAESIQKLDNLLEMHKTDGIREIEQIQKLAKQERERGLPCLLTFLGDKRPICFSYINESYLKENNICKLNEVTILCKVVRIIKAGQHICLTDLSEVINQRFPNTNKGNKERVKAIKSGEMAKIKEFEDRIDGPAFEVLPIAIYR